MKSKLWLLLVLSCVIKFGTAQNTTEVLDTSMFDKYFQTIPLTGLNGWIFKQGNDTNWSKNEIDTTGWIKMNPPQLKARNADKDGRLEGWFRMKFKLDSSFENVRIGISASRWAAVDIYIDGNYMTSYGTTGMNGKPYEENRDVLPALQQLQVETRKEHLVAVHIVDYVAPLNHRFLKTESLFNDFSSLIVLTGPLAYKSAIGVIRDRAAYLFLYSGLIGFLSVLFWFLFLQNSTEKNILYISISTSLFFVWPLSLLVSVYPLDMGFDRWWLTFFIALQLWPVAIASMVYTVGKIFSFKYKKALAIFGIFFVVSSVLDFYFNNSDFEFGFMWPLIVAILLFYISVSSWKRLRGAQWAVVAGIISTTIFSLAWAYLVNHYHSELFPHTYLYQSGMYLSLPVSLMIYVAMRFKEILTEVQVNAKQVVQLSEEKKEQAVKQQKILEEEVTRQTIELRTSFENLKATQAQLIQSEKMASLGELTAGIAHEIQNPLNFVNNFSDVNKELIGELKAESLKPKAERDDELQYKILKDIEDNEQRINHHGKRADAIVKSMLQHSRTSSGKKELTDINGLCDEYLRLAYHGLRAKDKSFSAKFETDFDSSIGKINVVPQDVGRVLLNLINNAFYAVSEKAKQNIPGYEPTVIVSTAKVNGKVEVKVKDNGRGIPQSIVDKIFQPFFTTKPAGQGTGLGLSLAYDIIKAHGGEIKVATSEGEGTEFTIHLPLSS